MNRKKHLPDRFLLFDGVHYIGLIWVMGAPTILCTRIKSEAIWYFKNQLQVVNETLKALRVEAKIYPAEASIKPGYRPIEFRKGSDAIKSRKSRKEQIINRTAPYVFNQY